MTTPRAVIDANLLVPILACDFLLTAFERGLFEPIVSAITIDEVERTLIDDFPHLDPDAIRRRVTMMSRVLDDHIVDTMPVDDLAPNGINVKDRHVVIAALAAEAQVVVSTV